VWINLSSNASPALQLLNIEGLSKKWFYPIHFPGTLFFSLPSSRASGACPASGGGKLNPLKQTILYNNILANSMSLLVIIVREISLFRGGLGEDGIAVHPLESLSRHHKDPFC